MPRRSRNALLISYAKNKIYLKALSVFREVAGQRWKVLVDQVSVSPGMGARGKLWSCSMLWIAGMVSCPMMCGVMGSWSKHTCLCNEDCRVLGQ